MIKNDELEELQKKPGCFSKSVVLFIIAITLVILFTACWMLHIYCVREKALKEISIEE